LFDFYNINIQTHLLLLLL